jgi:cellulose synthase/poly-beta-1,6-N-acetylglucosamine synthase-like glycosyltransferase
MIGFFNDSQVAAVTSRVLVKNRESFLGRLQAIEYKVIAFTRKILGFVDAIYVTNGPLSIYRRSCFLEVGGFDMKNLTEDIEITWNFVRHGYKIHMSLESEVYTVVPEKIRVWFNQRLRWNVGGMQTVNKYKKVVARVGMLGFFILPFFVVSWILGIIGLFILSYRISKTVLLHYLTASYSIHTQTAVMRLQDINLSPNVLVFFGILTICMSLSFTAIALLYSKEKDFKRHGILGLLAYIFVYLLAYPVLLVVSVYKFFAGKDTW